VCNLISGSLSSIVSSGSSVSSGCCGSSGSSGNSDSSRLVGVSVQSY
jgi:hypothetical protein